MPKKIWTHKEFKKAEFVGVYRLANDGDGNERTFRLVSKEAIKKDKKGILKKVIKTFESWQAAAKAGWFRS